jgi:hypothetical protein
MNYLDYELIEKCAGIDENLLGKENKSVKDLQYKFNHRISTILSKDYNCNCRNIGKNGYSCDDTLYFCDKCKDLE